MKVSVIIPAYNAERFIGRALESVAAQKSAEKCDVILVDDASTDGTARVAQESADAQQLNIRVMTLKKNAGPAAARNRGIEESDAEWIAFLDADDAWLPGKLEKQLELAEQREDICLWCAGVEETPESTSITELKLEDFVTDNPVATSTVMVRRQALQKAGGFDERFSGAEDYDLWLRLISKVNCKAARINQRLTDYRSERGSLSMDDRKFLPDALAVLGKAFSPGGALEEFHERKDLALGNQYWNASWMAFNRGSRKDAVRLWKKGYALAGRELDRPWWRLLIRYLIGRTNDEK